MARDSLYSCFIIEAAESVPPQWELFSYGRAQQITGSNKTASAAHTNVPRAGYTGLPMGWEARITRWRATTNMILSEPIMDWAAETDAGLWYGGELITRQPLLELLMAPQPLGEFFSEMRTVNGAVAARGTYLWLRENLSYEVRVETQRGGLIEDLQRFLITHTVHHRLICWVRLEGDIERAPL
jgi:hypothetical protein